MKSHLANLNSTSTVKPQERVVLGIDPGTSVMGYGVIRIRGKVVTLEAMGVIDLRKVRDSYLKLGRIHERMISLINAFLPDEMAIESQFFGKNVQSMLKLGRAQGVAIAAAISRDIPISEYAPMQIKKSITGRGSASKEQVAGLLQRILKISDEKMLPYWDATDALAVAYCHFLESQRSIPFVRSKITTESIQRLPNKHPQEQLRTLMAKIKHRK